MDVMASVNEREKFNPPILLSQIGWLVRFALSVSVAVGVKLLAMTTIFSQTKATETTEAAATMIRVADRSPVRSPG